MIKITAGLAEELIEWLELDKENAYNEDDEEQVQEMIDELEEALKEQGEK